MAFLEHPFGISVQFHGNSRDLHHKLNLRGFSYQSSLELCKMNACSSLNSSLIFKVNAGRTRAIASNSDFFWEEMPTPILDMVENPINMKNMSPKVERS